MRATRHVLTWGAAAAITLLLLAGVLRSLHRETQRRWAVQVSPQPSAGGRVFRDKGCAACHEDSPAGPELRHDPAKTGLPRLVTAMWNHAPQMWQAMQQQRQPFPQLSYEESGQLIAYLYFAGFADGAGDANHGRQLFAEKHCHRCHREPAPGSATPGAPPMPAATDPLSWTQALWNHASRMQARMREMKIDWPVLDASDLRDLFAFSSQNAGKREDHALGDPARGWKTFQQKRCIACHSVNGEVGSAPAFGAHRQLPSSFSEFGGMLLNHFPRMQQAMRRDGTPIPEFAGSDLSDIAAFLYSLNYTEPSGSPAVGGSLFEWRGCSRCHGANAEGTSLGPALRGRGNIYTATRFAADLWRHGASMYQQTQTTGQPWPVLLDSDIGNMLTFLNTPVEAQP